MSSVFGGVITEGLKKLLQALQALQPAPNAQTVLFDDTIILEKTGIPTQNTILDSNSILIEDTSGAPESVALDTTDLYFVNASAQNGAECMLGTITATHRCGLEVHSNTQGSLCSAMVGFEDSTPNYPTIALVNQGDNSALSIQLSTFFVASSTLASFNFEFPHKFFKWNAGASFQIDINDTHVEPGMAFKVSEGNPFNLTTYSDYLDATGQPGWSILLSNASAGDIDVTSPDCQFYSHPSGWVGSPFALRKFATARFTLVPTTTTSPGYAWAVSMY